jgi:hypothetical protein
MDLPDTAPYFFDYLETGEIDGDGYILAEERPIVDQTGICNWLDHDVLGAIKEGQVGGRIYGSASNRRVTSPLGDLCVTTNRYGFVILTRFVTSSALTGQAAEYRLTTFDDYDVNFTVTERSGKKTTENIGGYCLMERDPVAVRFVEMVDLVTANATPNLDITQRWYQLAA